MIKWEAVETIKLSWSWPFSRLSDLGLLSASSGLVATSHRKTQIHKNYFILLRMETKINQLPCLKYHPKIFPSMWIWYLDAESENMRPEICCELKQEATAASVWKQRNLLRCVFLCRWQPSSDSLFAKANYFKCAADTHTLTMRIFKCVQIPFLADNMNISFKEGS